MGTKKSLPSTAQVSAFSLKHSILPGAPHQHHLPPKPAECSSSSNHDSLLVQPVCLFFFFFVWVLLSEQCPGSNYYWGNEAVSLCIGDGDLLVNWGGGEREAG